MSAHRFKVGQTVVAPWSGPERGIPTGPYVIVRLLPLEDGEPHYRVRSSVDGHERVLRESQIRQQEKGAAAVEAPACHRSGPTGRDRGTAQAVEGGNLPPLVPLFVAPGEIA